MGEVGGPFARFPNRKMHINFPVPNIVFSCSSENLAWEGLLKIDNSNLCYLFRPKLPES